MTTDPLHNFGFVLREVSRLYALHFERLAAGISMTLAQCRVLCYLQRNEGISQVRLALLTDTDPMTLVRILDRMEADGLVERRPDPTDRRARQLHLKAPAQSVLDEISRVSERARAESFAGMPVAQRAQLLQLLQQVHANLDDVPPEAPPVAKAPARVAGKTAEKKAPARKAAARPAAPRKRAAAKAPAAAARKP